MKRLPRDPIRFDLFNAFADFGRTEKISLRDPAAADGFVERTRVSVGKSLSNEAMLYGLRTEAMFEALVVSLGAVDLLKQEDAGEIFAVDERLKVPDFRVVLTDGSKILIEVKNFYDTDFRAPLQLDDDYLNGLVRYSKMMSCDLFFAIHWASWNMWTLVPPGLFEKQDRRMSVELPAALKANHMAMLGDYSIGTRFPLSLVLYANKDEPRSLDADGKGTFTISDVAVQCAGRKLTSPAEVRIATYLMFYGKWQYEAEPKLVDDKIESVEHRWFPEVDHRQGFEIVGSLSEMFSTYFKFVTQDDAGIARLRVNVTPGFLGQLIPNDYSGENLPLWRFRQQPASSNTIGSPT